MTPAPTPTPLILQCQTRYVLDRVLGRGGMAEVLAGRKLGPEGVSLPVAIKRIRPDYSTDDRFHKAFRAMFVTEAQLNARLAHDNIVSILDFGEDAAGDLFLVMELVDGIDLNALLRTGHLPLPVALFVAIEILQGLAHAHDLPAGDDGVRGLVHRDVSPQNILLSWDGAVKVTDFGIAKARAATDASESPHSKGKFAYLSPEYARGRPLDGRSDLFAVGVVLWEMLVGEPLFNRDTDAATLAGVLFEPVPSPRLKRPEIPADIERITMCLLEKDRDDRYPNAKSVIAALKDCAAFGRHGRELLSSLLFERLPDVERAPGPSTKPNLELESSEIEVRSFRSVEKRVAGLLALPRAPRPAMRLAMFGAVVAVAAIVAIIAASVIAHDPRSGATEAGTTGAAASPPPSAAPPPLPGSGAVVGPPPSAPPAVRPPDEPPHEPSSPPTVLESPKITAGDHSEAPASMRHVNRKPHAAPAPAAPNRARIIQLDLDRLRSE